MRRLTKFVERKTPANSTLTLAYEKRQHSRFRALLDDGDEVGVILERGTVLRNGDCLGDGDGFVVEIKAAEEKVSTVYCDSAQDLARIAYHLGNRHMKLQIGPSWVRYLHDHVIDEMVKLFKLEVVVEYSTFEPETGAYFGHHHSHD